MANIPRPDATVANKVSIKSHDEDEYWDLFAVLVLSWHVLFGG
jgi:hypothetical protein